MGICNFFKNLLIEELVISNSKIVKVPILDFPVLYIKSNRNLGDGQSAGVGKRRGYRWEHGYIFLQIYVRCPGNVKYI
jgi:hypothetical protein